MKDVVVYRVIINGDIRSGFYTMGRTYVCRHYELLGFDEYNNIFMTLPHTPPPREDNLSWVEPYEYFGFRSIDCLKNWFRGDAFAALELVEEFSIAVIKTNADYVRYGNRQLVFDIRHSELLTTIHASELSDTNVFAGVAELVDAPDLGSGGEIRGGSTPPFSTKLENVS